MDRKHLVIVAIYFPPIISIASQRILAFTKYFDRKIFKITLITLDTGETWDKPEILQDVEIIRLKNDTVLKPVNLRKNYPYLIHKAGAAINKIMDLTIMDEYAGWTWNAATTLKKLYARQGIDIILSSFAPVASHLAVLKTKLPEKGVRWIADMRDEMSLNPFYSKVKRNYFSRIEQKIVDRAWILTTTSDVFLNNFKGLHKTSGIKFAQIKNGFDFDLPDTFEFNPVFTITHAGTFYGDIKPHTFFTAVSELIREGKVRDIRINLIGAGNAFMIPAELKRFINLTGRIPHHEAVAYMLGSDVNLIIMPASKKGTLPGKMYEYLATLKPILALMDKDEQAAGIIRKANAGFIAGFNDTDQIKEGIMKTHDLWAAHEQLRMDLEFINQFHRKTQVQILQDLILNTWI